MGDSFNTSSAISLLVQSLIGEVRDGSVALATFSAELRMLKENVLALNKIVKDGGEHEPLITKVALIEQSLEDIEGVVIKEMLEKHDRMKAVVDVLNDSKLMVIEEKKDKKDIRDQRVRFWGLIIAGVVSLGTSLIAIFK